MKVAGLITEYNPFHNGHLYHIRKTKEITGADHMLVVMSGDFVQRGAPAIMPKHIRTDMALKAGASVVMEIPVCFSLGSAEFFAAGAVSLLDKLNCIDAVCFGSECEDTAVLGRIAAVAAEEPKEYKAYLQEALKKGLSFPLARQTALRNYLKEDAISTILEKPNNILGIEYMKALYRRKSKIEVRTIKRAGAGYHDETIHKNFSSASAVRKLLSSAEAPAPPRDQAVSGAFPPPRLEGQVPSFCLPLFRDAYRKRFPVYTDDFSLILKYKLLAETPDSLTRYMDMTEELANRISKYTDHFLTFSQFCSLIKTRDMTYTRISRCLFHILLNITKEDINVYKTNGFCQYARILGFRKDSAQLLSCLKKRSEIPLITKPARTERLNSIGESMLLQDISASNLYESVIADKYKLPYINEYKKQIVRLS